MQLQPNNEALNISINNVPADKYFGMRCTECLKSEYLNYDLLGHYTASRGNFLPPGRDNLTVSSSGFKDPKRLILFGFSMRNNPEERSSQLLRGRSLKSR